MPKLKAPVVNNVFTEMTDNEGVVLSGNDYGEFHPTLQIRSITDLPKGGTFKGIDFQIDLNKNQARRYIEMTEKMRPAERINIDMEILKNKKFAMEVFKICSK